MTDVTAMGELLIDFANKSTDANGYPTMAANPGGAPGNFLAALNAYGCKTALIGKVGTDAFGDMLIGTLQSAGIETKGVIQDDDVFTTLAFVTIDSTGNRSFSFARKPGADTQIAWEEVDQSLIENARDFHFGTLSLTADPAREATRKAAAAARALGKWISFDPNLREPLWPDLEMAKQEILWGLSQADIVKISDEETEFLWPGITPEKAAQKIHDMGAAIVFVTLGANGAYYSGNGFHGHVPGLEGLQVKDTTGAGDIFGGSALSQLLQTGKELEELNQQDLEKACTFGVHAASLSTQNFGGISSVVDLQSVQDRIHTTEEQRKGN